MLGAHQVFNTVLWLAIHFGSHKTSLVRSVAWHELAPCFGPGDTVLFLVSGKGAESKGWPDKEFFKKAQQDCDQVCDLQPGSFQIRGGEWVSISIVWAGLGADAGLPQIHTASSTYAGSCHLPCVIWHFSPSWAGSLPPSPAGHPHRVVPKLSH